jgi:Mrp family chromosome partitioning ATPase/capsular polysaccharide biosynthesis protein
VTVIAVLAALIVILTATKRYDASADLQIQPLPAFGTDPFQGLDVFRQPADGSSPATGAASIFSSPGYLDLVRHRLGSRASGVHLSATPLSQSDMVSLGATASSPALAARAANLYSATVLKQRNLIFQREVEQRIAQLQLQMRQIAAKYRANSPVYQALAAQVGALRSYAGGNDPSVRELIPAAVPTAASWPRPTTTILVALVIGLLLGVASAVALELLNPRFTREDELTLGQRLPILARMPRLPSRTVQDYTLGRGRLPAEAWKAYRMLRAVLATAGAGGVRPPASILVTSGGPGDGKTMTAINLAIALSSSGLRVTLVDADVPRPMVATTFNVAGNRDGFVRLLNDPEADMTGLIGAPGHERLNLLLSSPEQIVQLYLFEPERIARVIERLREESDVVVIDSPPLPEVAEALALADASEAVLICVRIGYTRRDKLAELRDLLARRGVTPLGFFVTTRQRPQRRATHYGYPLELPSISGDQLRSRRAEAASAEGGARRKPLASADAS